MEEWVVRPRYFRDKRTGETKTSFNIMDFEHMEEINSNARKAVKKFM